MKSKLQTVTKEELKVIVKDNYMYSDVLRALGCKTTNGDSYRTLKNKIKEWGIDISHFKQINRAKNKLDANDLFVENCIHSRRSLKRYIIQHNLIPYECAICGNIGEWNGKSLTLTLDHINGINNDNRLENLQFVCPNCDSQQDTYGSKNFKNKLKYTQEQNISNLSYMNIKNNVSIKKYKKFCKNCGAEITFSSRGLCVSCYREEQSRNIPSKEILINELKNFTSFVKLGKKYNVTDNAIKRWCKKYNIPHLKKDLIKWIKEVGD